MRISVSGRVLFWAVCHSRKELKVLKLKPFLIRASSLVPQTPQNTPESGTLFEDSRVFPSSLRRQPPAVPVEKLGFCLDLPVGLLFFVVTGTATAAGLGSPLPTCILETCRGE